MPDINEPTEAALELGEKLKVPNVEFDAWVASMPAKHWSKYDLSACRLGWEAALDAERQKREAAERERDDYRRMFDECAVARDASGFLGTVPQCIEHWSRSYEAAEASLAKAIQERDEAREYGKQARLRENAAEDARIHEHDLRVAAEAEVSRLKAGAVTDGWRPIESAPKDGSWVELWRPLPIEDGPYFEPLIIARWYTFDDGDEAWAWPDDVFEVWTPHGRQRAEEMMSAGDCYEDAKTFTHWRPLSDPPAALSNQAGASK